MGATTALLLLAFVLAGSAGDQSSASSSTSPPADPPKSSSSSAAAFGEQRAEEELTKDNAQEEALVLFETILNGGKEIPKDEGMIVTSDDDDDNEGDDDDDGGDNDDNEDEIDEDISSDLPKSLAPDVPIRRQGDLYPNFDKKESDFSLRRRQDIYPPNAHASPFDFDADPSPRLTQGGYRRPHIRRVPLNVRRPSEIAERPAGAQDDGNMPLPIVPPVTYISAYPPQTDNRAMPPMFRHPLDSSAPFANSNGGATSLRGGVPPPSGNAHQPSAYPVFPLSNIQSRFAPRGNGFSDVSREPNPFSPAATPDLLYRSPPQFAQAQSVADALQSPVHNLFQTSSFTPYAGMNNAVADAPRPDYYTYFRNPSPHFQGNPRVYNALSNGSPGSSGFFLSYPASGSRTTSQRDPEEQQQTRDAQDADQIRVSPDKEDIVSVPFGTRIPQESPFAEPGDVYIRYPMKEAGYATEENLPATGLDAGPFPFLAAGRPHRGYSNPDSYRSRGGNGSADPLAGESVRSAPPLPFGRYPEGDPFYVRSPIVPPPFSAATPEQVTPPECAKDANSSSLCFNDPEYPRRELLYALNSDSFLLERLVASDQRLDGIPLVEGGSEGGEVADSPDNYACKSDLKYGTPLRAKNVQGAWKVVVNVERAIGGGKFIQPVRLEVCRGAAVGEPCSLTTEVRTRCVQKYSLQRLLSWSAEKGVHNDVFRLPVACSCLVLGGGN